MSDQFHVFANPGRRTREYPFVVAVQCNAFKASHRRLVVPLVRATEFGRVENARFNPTFNIQGIAVVLQPLGLVNVPRADLGEPLTSLTDEADRIIAALDEVFSVGYR
ncbi:CcdB family protein [Xanthomonas sp. NCPPB 2632]|uniref:CcdB family protein n=1 Tax=Xanthomonas sp. NCPPB 2632 TaxID=3240912 RepID=UPI0035197FEC